MKEFLVIVSIVVLFVVVMWAEGQRTEGVKEDLEHRFGKVTHIERRMYYKGPYWYAGKSTHIYHVDFANGKSGYVYSGMWGENEITWDE